MKTVLFGLLLFVSFLAYGRTHNPRYVLHIRSDSMAARAVAALEPQLHGHLPPLTPKAFSDVQSPYFAVYSARRTFCTSLAVSFGRAISMKRMDHATPKQNYADMTATIRDTEEGMGRALHPNPVRRWWLLTPQIRKRIIHLVYFDPAFAHATTEQMAGLEHYCLILPQNWTNKRR